MNWTVTRPIRVVVLDDHAVVRHGMAARLKQEATSRSPACSPRAGRSCRRSGITPSMSTSAATESMSSEACSGTCSSRMVGPVPLLVGTDDNLAELNRHRIDPPAVGADGVVFAAAPTVHDDEDAAICATPDALPAMVATVRSFARGALEVGPLTLRPRRNIHAPGPVDRGGCSASSETAEILENSRIVLAGRFISGRSFYGRWAPKSTDHPEARLPPFWALSSGDYAVACFSLSICTSCASG